MTRLAALMMLLAFSAVAQPSNAPPSDRRVVEVKNLKGPRLDQAVKLLTTFLLPGDATSYPELNSVVLRGTPEGVAAAETMLKKFDAPAVNPRVEIKPPESYQIRVHLVLASPEQDAPGPLPAEIEPAVQQMRKAFVYKSYKLLDTVILQGVAESGGTQLQGMVANPAFQDATFTTQVKAILPLRDGSGVLLRGFQFVVRKPRVMVDSKFPASMADARLDTDLLIRTGQKLVVGKLALEQNGSTIFLIITVDPVS